MNPRLLKSLDEVLGSGAEALLTTARSRGLLNDVALGVVKNGECFVRVIGEVGLDSQFELGSLTKTYTAELLAILVGRGVLRLGDPAAMYMTAGADGNRSDQAVTLGDLATHWSGLSRLPPMESMTISDPYAAYSAADLVQFLAGHGLRRAGERGFLYSNLGYSVLGYALGNAAGTTYVKLLQQKILEPLGMLRTALAMGQAQPDLLSGHNKSGDAVPHWHFDVCAPCGALCSTVGDQIRWLVWLLEDTERLAFQSRAAAMPGAGIGLGWILPSRGDLCWHNGATAGFSSWLSLDRRRREGVVVLTNRQAIGFIDRLGGRLQRCLAGEHAGEL